MNRWVAGFTLFNLVMGNFILFNLAMASFILHDMKARKQDVIDAVAFSLSRDYAAI